MLEWQVFCFVKGHILQYSTIIIFTVFWDFAQHFLRNAISESAEISRVAVPIPHWQINYEVFVKISEQFNKTEILNEELYFRIFSKQWFSWIFCLWVAKTFFRDFLCFQFCTQFSWFSCVSCIAKNLPLYFIHASEMCSM